MNELKTLNASQKELLIEAFKAVVSLKTADITDNHSKCCCFHMHPFHIAWDKETVREVIEQVRNYVGSWILYPLSEILGITEEEVTNENLIRWHRLEATRLEKEMEKKNESQ